MGPILIWILWLFCGTNSFMQTGKIESFFEGKKGVVAVYLFGSSAKKTKPVPEDVDIAVLFQRGSVPDFQEQIEMQEELVSLLKKEVDLVVLNRANPILKFQVLQHGRLIANADPSQLNLFVVRTLMEYDDIKRVRAPIERNILKGRVHGG